VLSSVDVDAGRVEAGDRVVRCEPGVVRGDVHAVLVEGPPDGKRVGRDDARLVVSWDTVTGREEVRPMNAVSMWVLPLVVTVGRLT
jgi:hypothetical protein